MVFHTSHDRFGSDGLSAPVIPRASRSARIRVPARKSRESDESCMEIKPFCKDWLALRPPSEDISDSRDSEAVTCFKNEGQDGKRKSLSENQRSCCSYGDLQNLYPFKKRKFFHQALSRSSAGSGDEFEPPDARSNDNKRNAGHRNTYGGDRNVKFSIKSFKIPELFLEIPVTATIGSLKRTVMEAMTAILKDGLDVGVILQGKKVSDDTKTLVQSGISRDNKHAGLGFMLEPSRTETARFFSQRLTRQGAFSSQKGQPCEGRVRRNSGMVPNKGDSLSRGTVPSSRLVGSTAFREGGGLLAVVPLRSKPERPGFVQRRVRRPFSVPEVEALVQAVEKLGTGRWRDVKSYAFDKVHHRTYVDLKDKWKTLVHTAKISPRQRRGEPVPQQLLDRVLAANAYWSEHQSDC